MDDSAVERELSERLSAHALVGDVAPHVTRSGSTAVADYLNRHVFTRRTRPSFATAFCRCGTARRDG